MKVDKKNLEKLTAQLKELANTKMQVGCKQGTHPDTDLSYAELMSIHEFGRTISNGFGKGIRIEIPARRPFGKAFLRGKEMIQTFQELKNANTTVKGINVKAIQNGLGGKIVEMIDDEINWGLTPALKESTLKIRARKGVGGNLPLLGATHELKKSIAFQIGK